MAGCPGFLQRLLLNYSLPAPVKGSCSVRLSVARVPFYTDLFGVASAASRSGDRLSSSSENLDSSLPSNFWEA